MIKKANNDENLKKFREAQKRSIIDDLAEEGLKMLDEKTKLSSVNTVEQKVPNKAADETKKPNDILDKNSKNPYILAKTQLLQKMDARKRSMIETMERIGDINNRIYDAFVIDIARLGDNL